jgi:hypothetical protein
VLMVPFKQTRDGLWKGRAVSAYAGIFRIR